jgi:transcriptional regulator with XRE-family HTH domain
MTTGIAREPRHPTTPIQASTARRLGRELDRWRREAGFTQRDLTRSAKVSQGQLSRILSGRFTRSSAAVHRLCAAAGIDMPQRLSSAQARTGTEARSTRTRRGTKEAASVRGNALQQTTLGSLADIGIQIVDERVYRMLLRRDGATDTRISSALGLSASATRKALASLEKNGFATHSPEHVRRYFAAPPDLAIEALMLRRQEQARSTIAELRESAKTTRGTRREESIVEILSREAAAQVFAQIIQSAEHDILGLERPPVLVSSNDAPDEMQLKLLARGVRFRSITDSSMLNAPGTLNRLRLATQAGEQYRVYPKLPFKLIVVDHRIGLIPLNLARPDGPALLVRSSSLLVALCEMFEMLWRSSVPFSLDEAVTHDDAPSQRTSARIDALLPMLVSGLNDKTIELELGVSQRTLTRRIVDLMKRLGATTRFQAGWLAAQAAHGDPSPHS